MKVYNFLHKMKEADFLELQKIVKVVDDNPKLILRNDTELILRRIKEILKPLK